MDNKAVPPDEEAYHLTDVPVAIKSATVAAVQKLCAAVPVGAGVVFIVTITSSLIALSQPPTV